MELPKPYPSLSDCKHNLPAELNGVILVRILGERYFFLGWQSGFLLDTKHFKSGKQKLCVSANRRSNKKITVTVFESLLFVSIFVKYSFK